MDNDRPSVTAQSEALLLSQDAVLVAASKLAIAGAKAREAQNHLRSFSRAPISPFAAFLEGDDKENAERAYEDAMVVLERAICNYRAALSGYRATQASAQKVAELEVEMALLRTPQESRPTAWYFEIDFGDGRAPEPRVSLEEPPSDDPSIRNKCRLAAEAIEHNAHGAQAAAHRYLKRVTEAFEGATAEIVQSRKAQPGNGKNPL